MLFVAPYFDVPGQTDADVLCCATVRVAEIPTFGGQLAAVMV